MISDKAIDCRPYNSSNTKVTWETCSLRKWLNVTFLKAAFSSAEQTMIADTNVSADRNPEHSTDPGNATTDKVFLLSIDEVNKYFKSDETRKCVPTDYTIANRIGTSSGITKDGIATCLWWLRTPGVYQRSAAEVYSDGSIVYKGSHVDNFSVGIRPAMWITWSD